MNLSILRVWYENESSYRFFFTGHDWRPSVFKWFQCCIFLMFTTSHQVASRKSICVCEYSSIWMYLYILYKGINLSVKYHADWAHERVWRYHMHLRRTLKAISHEKKLKKKKTSYSDKRMNMCEEYSAGAFSTIKRILYFYARECRGKSTSYILHMYRLARIEQSDRYIHQMEEFFSQLYDCNTHQRLRLRSGVLEKQIGSFNVFSPVSSFSSIVHTYLARQNGFDWKID